VHKGVVYVLNALEGGSLQGFAVSVPDPGGGKVVVAG
jgi:hypothetical protein